jgi:hypothetical protein
MGLHQQVVKIGPPYLALLTDDELQALENGFRQHLASGVVPVFVAKKFLGGETWVSDPIMRIEALAYLKGVKAGFPSQESTRA